MLITWGGFLLALKDQVSTALLTRKDGLDEPEYNEPPQEWLVVVQCRDEPEQSAVFEELQARGLDSYVKINRRQNSAIF